MNLRTIFAFMFVVLVVLNAGKAAAQTTNFTHHGNLGSAIAGPNFELEFKLFDTPTVGTGNQHGLTEQRSGVAVTNGEFSVQLDFTATVFTGAELFMETWWRDENGGGSALTVLPAREKVTAVYANRSLSAATADSATNATQLGGLASTSFIQNTAAQQAGGFNIAGDGTAGGTLSGSTVNATTQFNLGGSSNQPVCYRRGHGTF